MSLSKRCVHGGDACNECEALRDQFAMAAPEAPHRALWHFDTEEEDAKADAEWRYIHADAMLEARNA